MQLSKKINPITEKMMSLAQTYPTASAILYLLFTKADGDNVCVVPYLEIQEAIEVSRPTVARNIKVLKDLDIISVRKQGNNNVYIICSEVVSALENLYRRFGYVRPSKE